MPLTTTRELSGWGRYPVAHSFVQVPESSAEIDLRHWRSLIARGLGRSYGNAAMVENGLVLLTEKLNRSICFDESNGVLRAEAGMTLAEVLKLCESKGWFPAVVPGTKWVSLGGCVAADIHGKNHHRDGTFGSYVEELELILADGTRARCSQAHDPELFWATIGGMGLTGIITEVTIQLVRIASDWIIAQHHPAKNLETSLELLESPLWDDSYTVAWFDCLARGKSLGRSILIRGHHAQLDELPASLRHGLAAPPKPRLSVGIDLPSWILNSYTVGTFNEAYYRRQGMRRKPFLCDPDSFFFPLDRIANWNRLYGRRGFVQYQCVLPVAGAHLGLQQLLEESQRSGRASFLAVLKRFGPEGKGLLSFPMEGYTLTMDFPVTDPELFTFLDRLDQIVLSHGGRVYLAKDARLKANVFRQMYSRLNEWLCVKRRIDPDNRFDSDLARRVGLSNVANAPV